MGETVQGVDRRQRWAVLRPDALGDLSLSMPIVRVLRRQFPDWEILYAVSSVLVPLAQSHPDVSGVLPVFKPHGTLWSKVGQIFQLVRTVRSAQLDGMILPYFELTWAIIAFLARVPIRIGDQNKLVPSLFLTHRVPLNFRSLTFHEVESGVALLAPLMDRPTEIPAAAFPVLPEALAAVESLLARHQLLDVGLILIHPTTGGGNWAWSARGYQVLIDMIQSQTPYRVILTGATAGDQKIITEIQDAAKTPIVSLWGQTSILELRALLERVLVVIGTDTGPLHLLSGSATKAVVLSTTKYQKATRWAPWRVQQRVVVGWTHCPLVCNPWRCNATYCLDGITPARLYAEVMALLAEPSVIDPVQIQRHWFTVTAVIGIRVVSELEIPLIQSTIRQIQTTGIRIAVSVSTPELARWFSEWPEIPVSVHRWVQPGDLVQWVTRLNISVVHCFTRNAIRRWSVLRQISAPRVAVPFVIVVRETADDWISVYMEACRDSRN